MKEALALLINDIHISKDNIDEFNKNWNEAVKICQMEGISEIIVGGDMFTERSSQTLAVLLAVKHALDYAVHRGIRVTIAEGNHDIVDKEAFEGYNHLWIGQKDIDVIDTYRILSWEGCDFVLAVMSYFPENGSFLDWLDKMRDAAIIHYGDVVRSEQDIILYIHEGVQGALGSMEVDGEVPQEPLLDYKSVLCGHYHNRIKLKGTDIQYIGSSRQHNFGEDEEKGYTILYSDGSTDFVKNEVNIRYKTVEIDYDNINVLNGYFSDDTYKNYRVRVKVHCTEQQAKIFDKQQLLNLGFNKVEMVLDTPVVKESVTMAIEDKFDKQGIKKEYQNFCNEQDIDSELGIKYLEG